LKKKKKKEKMPIATNVRFCPSTNTKIDIAYEEFGDQENHAILLIPGLNATCRMYDDKLVEKFVAAGYRVVRMDNRDSGLSSNGTDNNWGDPWLFSLLTPTWASPAPIYTLDCMARDAWALLDRLQIKHATLLGSSMGGQIAQVMTLQQPTRVTTLVSSMTSTGGKNLSSPPLWLQLEFLKSPPKDATHEEIVAWKTAMVQKCFVPTKDEVQSKHDHGLISQHIGRAQERSSYRQGGLRQLYAILHARPREEMLKELKDVPVFILHGKQDLVFGIDHAERQKEIFQNSVLHVVETMGHYKEVSHMDGIVNEISKHIEAARSKKKIEQ
jgi:pimeloyl-ACP methyl ester carboxylesterase